MFPPGLPGLQRHEEEVGVGEGSEAVALCGGHKGGHQKPDSARPIGPKQESTRLEQPVMELKVNKGEEQEGRHLQAAIHTLILTLGFHQVHTNMAALRRKAWWLIFAKSQGSTRGPF